MIIVEYPAIDYLKMSIKGGAIEPISRYFNCADTPKKERKIMQYVGQMDGGMFLGFAEIHDRLWGLLDIPGAIAHDAAPGIYDMQLGDEGICKRIDYQLTLPELPDYDPFLFRESLSLQTKRDVGIEGVLGKGITVSVGSRSTGKYIRIYEKKVDEGGDGLWWLRFEVEYTGYMSAGCWRSTPLNAVGIICHELHQLKVHGYALEVLQPFLDVCANAEALHIKRIKPPPSIYRWLETQVAPAIFRMMASHDVEDREFIDTWITTAYERLQIMNGHVE